MVINIKLPWKYMVTNSGNRVYVIKYKVTINIYDNKYHIIIKLYGNKYWK